MTLKTHLRLLLDSRLMNLPYFLLKRELERVERYDLPLSYEDLRMYHMSGGQLSSLVDGLIYAREHGLAISPIKAMSRNLFAQHDGRTLTQHLQELEAAGVRDFDRAPLRVEDIGKPLPPRRAPEEIEASVQRQLREINAEFDRATGWLLNRRGERIYLKLNFAFMLGAFVALLVMREDASHGPGLLYTFFGGFVTLLLLRFFIYANPNTMADATLAQGPPSQGRIAMVLIGMLLSLAVTGCGIVGIFSPATLDALLSAIAPF